jgi:hypothetical protein
MLEVQVGLDQRKDEFLKHEEEQKRKEEELRRKDLELQESLVKFNRFLLVISGDDIFSQHRITTLNEQMPSEKL